MVLVAGRPAFWFMLLMRLIRHAGSESNSVGIMQAAASPITMLHSPSNRSPAHVVTPAAPLQFPAASCTQGKRGSDTTSEALEQHLSSPEKRLCTGVAGQAWQVNASSQPSTKHIQRTDNVLGQGAAAQLSAHKQPLTLSNTARDVELKAACQLYAASLRAGQPELQRTTAAGHQQKPHQAVLQAAQHSMRHAHCQQQQQQQLQAEPKQQHKQQQQQQQQWQQQQHKEQQQRQLQQQALATYQAALGRTAINTAPCAAAAAAAASGHASVAPHQENRYQQGQQQPMCDQPDLQPHQQLLHEQGLLQPMQQQHSDHQTVRRRSEPVAAYSAAQMHNVYKAFQWQKDAIEFADACNQQAAFATNARPAQRSPQTGTTAGADLHQVADRQEEQGKAVPEVVKVRISHIIMDVAPFHGV